MKYDGDLDELCVDDVDDDDYLRQRFLTSLPRHLGRLRSLKLAGMIGGLNASDVIALAAASTALKQLTLRGSEAAVDLVLDDSPAGMARKSQWAARGLEVVAK